MNEALQARVDKIRRELDKREAALTTSERQARYVLGANRREEPAEARDDTRDHGVWGDDGERGDDGDAASRRQAAKITRGRS